MNRILFAAAALAFALGSSAFAQTARLSGAWSGLGLQVGPAETWTISMTLGPGGSGRISYPSLQCGGDLIFESARGPVSYYREHITYGDCVDNGLIGVYPHARHLMWFWSGEDTAFPDMAASAVLDASTPIS